MNPELLGTFGELSPEVADAVASAETGGNKPRVIGTGIYLELPNETGQQITQIMITPEGTTEKGQAVSMAVISRTISDWSPRKQWRTNFVRPSKELTEPSDRAFEMTQQIERTLQRQIMYGLKELRGSRPIVFELTDADFTEISEWKAPASALRRIQKTRLALGFPEKIYTSPATPATI